MLLIKTLTFVMAALLISTIRTSAEQAPIKVGVILPLTGNASAYGNDVRNSLLFANDRLANGKFKFIFEDDQCHGKEAVTAASKLLSVDHISYGIVVCTESMLSTAPLFESHKIIAITPIAAGASVTKAGDYTFRLWPSDAGAGQLLANYLRTRVRNLAILSEERGFPQEFVKSFGSSSREIGLQTIAETYHTGEISFIPILLKLRKSNPDGLLVITDGAPPFITILKQLNELRWRPQVYAAYEPASKAFLDNASELAEGIIFADAPSTKVLTTEGKNILIVFEREFGPLQSVPLLFATTFEVVRLIEIISKTEADPRSILYNGSFEGIFGKYSFDKNGDIVGLNHVLRIIKGGESKPLPMPELK